MADAPERLPRGRHKLSREEVVASQRGRMLLAIADAVADKGYVDTTVADVLKGAAVSRETFYQQFTSKLDCFMAAFDAAADILFANLQPLLDAPGEPVERLDLVIAGYLDTLASQPGYAHVFLVDVYAAGPDALRRRAAVQRRIVDAVLELLELGEDVRFEAELIVHGIAGLVTQPVVAGDLDALRALRTPIFEHVSRRLLSATP